MVNNPTYALPRLPTTQIALLLLQIADELHRRGKEDGSVLKGWASEQVREIGTVLRRLPNA